MNNIIIISDKAEHTVLQPTSCSVHGELNGDLSCKLTVSSESESINFDDCIQVDIPSLTSQQFRIYSKEKSINSVTFKAKHVFYDLFDNYIIDKRPTDASPQQALERFLEGLSYSTPFSIGEVFTGSNKTAYWEYKNPVEALLGTDDNSFINRWGGELKRDNWQINFYERVARRFDYDGEVVIPHVFYGKDITELEQEKSVENTVTRIIPTGLNSDNSIVKLPEIYVDSPHISDYAHPKIKRIHYSWLKLGEGGRSTLEQIYVELRRCAQAEFAKGVDLPQLSGKISLIDASRTEEFKGIDSILPYDDFIVTDRWGEEYSARMTAFDYDCLSEKYINLTIGNVNTMQNFEKLIKAIK